MECICTIAYDNTIEEISCKKGSTLLDILPKEATAFIDTPCGGKGLCGKCKVRVSAGGVDELSGTEQKKLTKKELEELFKAIEDYGQRRYDDASDDADMQEAGADL